MHDDDRRTLPANFTTILPTLCWDQLATAYEILNEHSMDESEVRYMCGRPADFQPIAA